MRQRAAKETHPTGNPVTGSAVSSGTEGAMVVGEVLTGKPGAFSVVDADPPEVITELSVGTVDCSGASVDDEASLTVDEVTVVEVSVPAVVVDSSETVV
jgi:hypothetical protein